MDLGGKKMANEVVVGKVSLPEGVTRKSHFLGIKKDLTIVAIKKWTPEMRAKANATRKCVEGKDTN